MTKVPKQTKVKKKQLPTSEQVKVKATSTKINKHFHIVLLVLKNKHKKVKKYKNSKFEFKFWRSAGAWYLVGELVARAHYRHTLRCAASSLVVNIGRVLDTSIRTPLVQQLYSYFTRQETNQAQCQSGNTKLSRCDLFRSLGNWMRCVQKNTRNLLPIGFYKSKRSLVWIIYSRLPGQAPP